MEGEALLKEQEYRCGLISIITATLLLSASLLRGIPASLVQMNTGAIIGLGIVKFGYVDIWRSAPLVKIFTVWIVAPLIALCLSILFTVIAEMNGLL